jgi:hypothetical protein
LLAREWLRVQHRFPKIGERPVNQIRAPELSLTLRRIEEAGHREAARRTKQRCSQIFRPRPRRKSTPRGLYCLA